MNRLMEEFCTEFPTVGQMARITGLAQASKIYRSQLQFKMEEIFQQGNEVVLVLLHATRLKL